MTHTLDMTQFQWKDGDRVHHVYDPNRLGTVERVVEKPEAVMALVRFDGSKVSEWLENFWLRRAK